VKQDAKKATNDKKIDDIALSKDQKTTSGLSVPSTAAAKL
jgi:hypothetical protein